GFGGPSTVVRSGSVPSQTRTWADRSGDASTTSASTAASRTSGEPQNTRRILVVHLAQDCIRQLHPVDAPTALRRHGRRRVIEVFIIRFQESIEIGRASCRERVKS